MEKKKKQFFLWFLLFYIIVEAVLFFFYWINSTGMPPSYLTEVYLYMFVVLGVLIPVASYLILRYII